MPTTLHSNKKNHNNKHNKKKKQQQVVTRRNKDTTTTTTAEEYATAGHAALQSLDPHQAIALYTSALLQHAAEHATPTQVHIEWKVSVLESLAEAQVSIADHTGASRSYHEALQLYRDYYHVPESLVEHANDTTIAPHIPADVWERMASWHLFLGQLSAGSEALSQYQHGIEYLRRALSLLQQRQLVNDTELDNTHADSTTMEEENDSSDKDPTTTTTPTVQSITKQLAQACCSSAELYLTDLCMEDQAEQHCERYVHQALHDYLDSTTHEPYVDAWQTAASLRLSQRRLDAVDCILRAYPYMKEGCQSLASLVGLGNETSTTSSREPAQQALELSALESVQDLPGFEFRCQTAKLLLECAQVCRGHEDPRSYECVASAIAVLGSLLAENDEVIEIWMLLGDAMAALEATTEALHYWQQARTMLQAVKKSLTQAVAETADPEEEDELQNQLDEVTCQCEELEEKIQEINDDDDSASNMDE
jgi:tetratricopeptide (TPR) repeat protein